MSLNLHNVFFNRIYNPYFDFTVINSKQFNLNILKNNEIYYKYLPIILIKIKFLKRINFEFSEDDSKDINTIYSRGNYSKINKDLILIPDGYFKNPSISFIIDNMNITFEELNDLLDSIHKQNFHFFNIFLNENLKSNVSKEYLSKSNLNIIEDTDFKETCINGSKAKYSIFVDVLLIYKKSTLNELPFKIENNQNDLEDVSFVSTPIYQGNDENNKFDYLSSQKLSYFYRNVPNPSKKSKFLIFNLYLLNKLFNLNYLKKNRIYFDKFNEDMLKIYKKIISTKLLQKDLFKSSFKNKNVLFSTNIFYRTNKLFLIILSIKNILKNGAR